MVMHNDQNANDFLQHTKKQFVQCCIDSGIFKQEEKEIAEKHLDDVMKQIVFSSDIDMAAVRTNITNGERKIILRDIYKTQLESATSYDDDCFDNTSKVAGKKYDALKKVLFHELFHVMQRDNMKLTDTKVPKSQYATTDFIHAVASPGNLLPMNEIAATYAEEILWKQYLTDVKGHDDVEMKRYDGKSFGSAFFQPVAVRSKENLADVNDCYTLITSIGERLISTIGVAASELARSSTIFGGENRKDIRKRYEETTGKDFSIFLTMLNRVEHLSRKNWNTLPPNVREVILPQFCLMFGLAVDGLENPKTGEQEESSKWIRMALQDAPIEPIPVQKKIVLPDDDKAPGRIILPGNKPTSQKLILPDDIER